MTALQEWNDFFFFISFETFRTVSNKRNIRFLDDKIRLQVMQMIWALFIISASAKGIPPEYLHKFSAKYASSYTRKQDQTGLQGVSQ